MELTSDTYPRMCGRCDSLRKERRCWQAGRYAVNRTRLGSSDFNYLDPSRNHFPRTGTSALWMPATRDGLTGAGQRDRTASATWLESLPMDERSPYRHRPWASWWAPQPRRAFVHTSWRTSKSVSSF